MNLEKLLKEYPTARERSNKNKAIAFLLQRKYRIDLPASTLTDLVAECHTLDRQWRKLLQDNPSLRGSDYDQKMELEQKKQIELGYEVGYHKDIKQSSLL